MERLGNDDTVMYSGFRGSMAPSPSLVVDMDTHMRRQSIGAINLL